VESKTNKQHERIGYQSRASCFISALQLQLSFTNPFPTSTPYILMAVDKKNRYI